MSFYRGYISNFFTSSFILVLIGLLCLLLTSKSYAQETSTNKTTISSSESSKKTKNEKQRQALSQGYSASEALLMTEKNWNFVASQTFARGMDEFEDTYLSITSLDLSYRVNSWSALVLSGGYNTVALNHDGELFNNYEANPDLYGLTDFSAGYSIPGVWRNDNSSINYFGAITFPTSQTSQNATMIGSISNSFIYRYRPNSKLILSASASAVVSHFRRDDADVFGTQVNSPFGISYAIGSSYRFFNWLIGSLSYSQFQRLDYDENWDTIQTAVASLNFNVTPQVGLSTGYRYRDRIITNDEMFDDDKSLAFIGVSYAF